LAQKKEKPFKKFATLSLFVKRLPINFARIGEHGNKEFYRALHVQIANKSRSPQSQADDR
jgi:hypothetical protein